MPDIIELLKNAAKVVEYQTEVERLRAENARLTESLEQLRAACEHMISGGNKDAINRAREELERCGWRWPRYRIIKDA